MFIYLSRVLRKDAKGPLWPTVETHFVCALCVFRRATLSRPAVGTPWMGERRVRARKRSFRGPLYKQPLSGNRRPQNEHTLRGPWWQESAVCRPL